MTALGERMKALEDTRTLPGEQAIIRIDGKAWHTYTRRLDKPFDRQLMADMEATTVALCERIQGAQWGYTQSDEISILIEWTGNACPWFGGRVQKIASVAASIATRAAAQWAARRSMEAPLFDARVFPIPADQVTSYLLWRVRDSRKNCVASMAHHRFGHKALMGRHTTEKLEMLGLTAEVLVGTREYDGALYVPAVREGDVTYTRRDTGETLTTTVQRRVWERRPVDDLLEVPA